MRKLYSLRKLFSNTYEDHPGRPGKVGGSLPRSYGSARSKVTASRYKSNKGHNIYKVSRGSELPDELIDEIERNAPDDGMVRFTFNSITKNWHISGHGIYESDHGDFLIQALEGQRPRYTEQIEARGIYDIVNNTLTFYDFSTEAESIASEGSGLNERSVLRDMEKVQRTAEKSMFYLGGRKPSIEYIPIETVFGNEAKAIVKGKRISLVI